MGQKIFVDENSRKNLAFLTPDDGYPLWKICSKFVGQDIMRISLPVIINEPLSGLQRMCDSFYFSDELFYKAGSDPDRLKRMCYSMVAATVAFYSSKFRKRKPFNPMLGETYEFITNNFRFISEKVEHTPEQIMAS